MVSFLQCFINSSSNSTISLHTVSMVSIFIVTQCFCKPNTCTVCNCGIILHEPITVSRWHFIEAAWDCEMKQVQWTFPHSDSQRVKYLVFRDLWQQQFTLTCGAKFGGDFLVYPGAWHSGMHSCTTARLVHLSKYSQLWLSTFSTSWLII